MNNKTTAVKKAVLSVLASNPNEGAEPMSVGEELACLIYEIGIEQECNALRPGVTYNLLTEAWGAYERERAAQTDTESRAISRAAVYQNLKNWREREPAVYRALICQAEVANDGHRGRPATLLVPRLDLEASEVWETMMGKFYNNNNNH